jgi:hypothetical protein
VKKYNQSKANNSRALIDLGKLKERSRVERLRKVRGGQGWGMIMRRMLWWPRGSMRDTFPYKGAAWHGQGAEGLAERGEPDGKDVEDRDGMWVIVMYTCVAERHLLHDVCGWARGVALGMTDIRDA